MIALATYLLKVILCSGLLLGYYLLALRNRNFHHWNRYYLLASMVISMALPLCRISLPVEAVQERPRAVRILDVVTTGDAYLESFSEQATSRPGWEDMAGLVYFLVSAVLLALFLRGILYIRSLIRRYPREPVGDFFVVSTTEKAAPFSFLRYVFWHAAIDLSSSTGQQILRHEIAHIRQKHSLDKIFVQIVLACYWINPFFWLTRKELGMIHEFIADQESVDHGDTAAFAAMILQAAYPQQGFGLSNQFFHSPIQRRIHMLLKSKNKKVTYITRIMALPLLALIGVAFTVRTMQTHGERGSFPLLDKPMTVVIDAGHGGDDTGVSIENGVSEKDLNLAIARRIRELNQDPGLHILLLRDQDVRQDVREKVSKTMTLKPDAFVSIHINGATEEMEENQRGGIEIYVGTRNQAMMQESRLLGSILNVELGKSYPTLDTLKTRPNAGIWVLDAPGINYPRVLVEAGYLTNEKDRAFLSSADNIDRIALDILRALKRFGSERSKYITKVSGSFSTNGGVAARTASPIDTSVLHVGACSMTITSSNPWDIQGMDKPLVILDGRHTNMASLFNKTIEADSAVFYPKKHPATLQQFGEEGREGVVEFFNARVKDDQKAIADADVRISGRAALTGDTGLPSSKTATAIGDPEPLYVLDGMIISRKVDKNALNLLIKPEDIESVDVLKGQSALSIYGEEGKYGVVIITSKKYAKENPGVKPSGVGGKSRPRVELTEMSVDDQTPVFTSVDEFARPPGGEVALSAWLRTQLDKQPSVLKDPEAFRGRAGLRFIVNSLGQVTNVSLLNSKEETYNSKLSLMVSALLQKGPLWEPARQNGQKVRSFKDWEFEY